MKETESRMPFGGCFRDSTSREEKLGRPGGRGREVGGPSLMGVEPGHSKESEARPPGD